jgi:hypothetical protein
VGGDITDPDGCVLNIGLAKGFRGFAGGGVINLIRDFKMNKSYISISGEVGLAPTTLFAGGQYRAWSPSISFGYIFGADNVGVKKGMGEWYTQATWPAVIFRFPSFWRALLGKGSFYRPVQALTNYISKNNIAQRQAMIQLTHSLNSSTSSIAIGLANYTLSWEVGYAFGPWEISELNNLRLPDIVTDKIQRVRGAFEGLSWSGNYDVSTNQLGNVASAISQ